MLPARDLEVDANGNLYVVGYLASGDDIPLLNPIYDQWRSNWLGTYDSTGRLQMRTYFGPDSEVYSPWTFFSEMNDVRSITLYQDDLSHVYIYILGQIYEAKISPLVDPIRNSSDSTSLTLFAVEFSNEDERKEPSEAKEPKEAKESLVIICVIAVAIVTVGVIVTLVTALIYRRITRVRFEPEEVDLVNLENIEKLNGISVKETLGSGNFGDGK